MDRYTITSSMMEISEVKYKLSAAVFDTFRGDHEELMA